MKAELVDINDLVNQSIKGLAEPAGRDLWQTPEETLQLHTGDCEDYALLKYFACVIAGYDAQVLTVRHTTGAHVVVLADPHNHKWVLDNISTEIVSLDARLGVDILELQRLSVLGGKHNDPRFDSCIARIVRDSSDRAIAEFFGKAGLSLSD